MPVTQLAKLGSPLKREASLDFVTRERYGNLLEMQWNYNGSFSRDNIMEQSDNFVAALCEREGKVMDNVSGGLRKSLPCCKLSLCPQSGPLFLVLICLRPRWGTRSWTTRATVDEERQSTRRDSRQQRQRARETGDDRHRRRQTRATSENGDERDRRRETQSTIETDDQRDADTERETMTPKPAGDALSHSSRPGTRRIRAYAGPQGSVFPRLNLAGGQPIQFIL
ncbi:hypothetical protein CALVIDRAFT_233938 [Calocera viscosa TUFC12733]|uniref:Uncharacterized protein n=1 Tax=Calocera viscosa (strain TUFC12733) TaxID=1330018 RepID=A0A167JYP9_CALVF|nr:hypothetical protein CALVIDRAFT_233938 [Calocera viscosa TUFC12733]